MRDDTFISILVLISKYSSQCSRKTAVYSSLLDLASGRKIEILLWLCKSGVDSVCIRSRTKLPNYPGAVLVDRVRVVRALPTLSVSKVVQDALTAKLQKAQP